jgi:hypothetical protein
VFVAGFGAVFEFGKVQIENGEGTFRAFVEHVPLRILYLQRVLRSTLLGGGGEGVIRKGEIGRGGGGEGEGGKDKQTGRHTDRAGTDKRER